MADPCNKTTAAEVALNEAFDHVHGLLLKPFCDIVAGERHDLNAARAMIDCTLRVLDAKGRRANGKQP